MIIILNETSDTKIHLYMERSRYVSFPSVFSAFRLDAGELPADLEAYGFGFGGGARGVEDWDGRGGLGGGVFSPRSDANCSDIRGFTGGGTLSWPEPSTCSLCPDASEADRDNRPGLLDEPTVPLRGMGTGVRGFVVGSSRDMNLISEFVFDDVVSEMNLLSTEDENVSLFLTGTSGGLEPITVGKLLEKKSIFLGVEDIGIVPARKSLFGGGGLLGDRSSASKDDDAE